MIQKKRVLSPKCFPKPNEPELNFPKSASLVVDNKDMFDGSFKGLTLFPQRTRIGSGR